MVLARKYRPRSFEAMVGQGHVVQALSNALTQQRLHHAYMFTGTRGVGKTTVSRILAKSLNCVGPDGNGTITATPCGQCQPCQDIDSGRFVDYVELDAASNRGVDEISQLLDQAVYKPVVGRFKVYMIDEVHMLSNTAFNAMLKTLEEPPDYLKFVLATTDPQKVPVTVLSRCLQFNLRPMAMQTVHEHLAQVLGAEAVAFEPGALRLLARAARGSMRDALSLTDQAIAFGAGRLEEAVVRQMLGSVDRQHVARILDAVALQDGAALVDAVDGLRKLGLSAMGALDDLAAALQHMAVLQTVPSMADGDEDLVSWRDMATRFAPDETQLFYSLALHGRGEIALAPDEYSGLLMVLLRWLAFKPGAAESPGPKAESPVAQVAAGPSVASTPVAMSPGSVSGHGHAAGSDAAVFGAIQAAPTVTPRPAVDVPTAARPPASATLTTAPTVPQRTVVVPAPQFSPDDGRPEPPPWDDEPSGSTAPGEPFVPVDAPVDGAPEVATASIQVPQVPTTPLGDRWADTVALLQREGLIAALVRELAMQAECVAVQDDPELTVWRLRVERESLRTPAQVDRLTQALQKGLGGTMRVDVEAGVARDCPALRDQAAKASRQLAAESLIKGDPLVQRLLEQFPGARLVSGSISPIAPKAPAA
jgi:DNA polymerase-3 subunit gamma/tau